MSLNRVYDALAIYHSRSNRERAEEIYSTGALADSVVFEASDRAGGAACGIWLEEEASPIDLFRAFSSLTPKNQPLVFQSGRPFGPAAAGQMFCLRESGGRYASLYRTAFRAAASINHTSPASALEGEAVRYVREAAARVVAHDPERILTSAGYMSATHTASEALELLAHSWPDFSAGKLTGAEMLRSRPGLWEGLMCDWPIASLAEMCAAHLIGQRLVGRGGRVMEVGAGVGATTRLLKPFLHSDFLRADLMPAAKVAKYCAAPGEIVQWNFDEPPPVQSAECFDTIYITSALHCAADPLQSLRYLHSMLRPGGTLVLAEGNPQTTEDGHPWALDMFFGTLPGWYLNGGLRPRVQWLSLMAAAGFCRLGFAAHRAGINDLGGLVWAERSAL